MCSISQLFVDWFGRSLQFCHLEFDCWWFYGTFPCFRRGIYSDFRELSFCGPCGPCLLRKTRDCNVTQWVRLSVQIESNLKMLKCVPTVADSLIGLLDKGLVVVCNCWDLEPLDLLNGLALGCYQLFPEVWFVWLRFF